MYFAVRTGALAESGCTVDYMERLAVDEILNAHAFVGTQINCMDGRFPLGTVH